MLEERESKKENNELEDINDVDIKGAGGTMFTAGQETVSVESRTLCWPLATD